MKGGEKSKVVGLPGNIDKSLFAEDKPDPLDGHLQHAWNMLQAINKRLGQTDQLAKKSIATKGPTKGRGDSPKLCTHMKSLLPLPLTSPGVTLMEEEALFKEEKSKCLPHVYAQSCRCLFDRLCRTMNQP